MKHFALALATTLAFGETAMAKPKTYEGKIQLTTGGTSISVRCEAESGSQARKIIEAQYGDRLKRWTKSPQPVR